MAFYLMQETRVICNNTQHIKCGTISCRYEHYYKMGTELTQH